jgi:hypothetical protein
LVLAIWENEHMKKAIDYYSNGFIDGGNSGDCNRTNANAR